MINHDILVLPSEGKRNPRPCDDRAGFLKFPEFSVFYLADGATGVGYGGKAAEAFCDSLTETGPEAFLDSSSCVSTLFQSDMAVYTAVSGNGDTTGIVFATDGVRFWGGFAGDSQIVHFSGETETEITSRQFAKPRFGSGAFPGPFESMVGSGDVILIGSDGLWDFTYGDSVKDIVRSSRDASEITSRLPALIRSENGGILPDDFSCVALKF